MALDIYVCLDLGNDTLKLSFAYKNKNSEHFGKFMLPDLINQAALPASAYYDEEEEIWKYADEVETENTKSFSTVVKIKFLLSLFMNDRSVVQFYPTDHYFPKFQFPIRRRTKNGYIYMVEQKMVFEAPKFTPKSVCEGFFEHVKAFVDKEITALGKEKKLTFNPLTHISLVHPPKQSDEYMEELIRLVTHAFGVAPCKVLTSTQALGLFAYHRKMLNTGDKTLLFDMGDETISVTKAWPNEIHGGKGSSSAQQRIGILVDSPDGHSEPLDIGGSDIDEEIGDFLEACTHNRETVGSPPADQEGHIFENGLCAEQYLLMKDIKKAKIAMALTGKGILKDGVPISLHREVLVQRMLSQDDFQKCVGIKYNDGIAKKITTYMLEELARPGNRDVTKILIAGGTIETFGLLPYIRKALSERFSHIQILTFGSADGADSSVHTIKAHESSAYAASAGGAIVAMKDYSVDAVLSYSYGTWLYCDDQKYFKIFANRGDLLLEEHNRFPYASSFTIGPKDFPEIEDDAIFSAVITQQEIDHKIYNDRLTYRERIVPTEYNRSEKRTYLIIGEANSFDRRRAEEAVDLKVVTGNEHASIYFYYKGERVSLFHRVEVKLHFEEGFIVTKKGIATPFFTNCKEKNDTFISARSMRTGAVYKINARDIEFRSSMDAIEVSTGK